MLQPSNPPQKPKVILSIAGFDSSCGAGTAADLRAFAHWSCYGVAAVTTIVAESTTEVRQITPLHVDQIKSQVELLLEQYPVAAIKTGLLPNEETITALLPILEHATIQNKIPLIIDPVVTASTGDRLSKTALSSSPQQQFFALASLITPNLDEASLLAKQQLHQFTDVQEFALFLRDQLQAPVLLKGGHFPGETIFDLLAYEHGVEIYTSPRVDSPASHGTGCALAAAIAAKIALGDDLKTAVELARNYVHTSLSTPLLFQNSTSTTPQYHLGSPPIPAKN